MPELLAGAPLLFGNNVSGPVGAWPPGSSVSLTGGTDGFNAERAGRTSGRADARAGWIAASRNSGGSGKPQRRHALHSVSTGKLHVGHDNMALPPRRALPVQIIGVARRKVEGATAARRFGYFVPSAPRTA